MKKPITPLIYNNAEKALKDYRNDVDTVNSGYNIIRYVNSGVYEAVPSKEFLIACEFIDWGIRNPAFVWLRMVKEGYIQMNESLRPNE